MPTGSATILQVGGRGCSARVRLEVTQATPPHKLEIAEGVSLDHYFLPAVEAGVWYAWERLLFEGQKPPHVQVRVLELTTTIADTSIMGVINVSALALCDGIGMQLKGPPRIDQQTREISFSL